MTHTCDQFDPANPPAQWVQDGWRRINVQGDMFAYTPNLVLIKPKWLDLPCQYSNRAIDPDCAHCGRRKL